MADIDQLIAFSDTNQGDVKNYFESPVELDKESIYPVDNYGSALAPFYIPISLWIGCIIAVAMISMRVKTGRIYNAASVYLGRMGIFIIIALLQALLVAIGSLYLHVQLSSALLFCFDHTVYWYMRHDNSLFNDICFRKRWKSTCHHNTCAANYSNSGNFPTGDTASIFPDDTSIFTPYIWSWSSKRSSCRSYMEHILVQYHLPDCIPNFSLCSNIVDQRKGR